MAVEVVVPSAGESITEVFIGTWQKNVGDSVARDEIIVEIETDKATLDVRSPVDGTIEEILKSEGDSAQVGEVIIKIAEGAAPAEAPAATEEKPAEAAQAPTPAAAPAAAQTGGAVMPAAGRALAEAGVSADSVPGTGLGGRVLKEDAQRAIQAAGSFRQEDVVPMTLLRRRIAERLVESQQSAALLTTFNEIDMSNVMNLRKEYRDDFEKRYGVRLGFMSFFIKAVVDALKLIPELNAEIRGTDIVYKNYYDVGVAVSGRRGLVVPVIKNAERLSFAELEASISDFAQRAQNNKLLPDELTGGTFTVSNGGVFGSLMSTPIVNPPQTGILGMHAIQERPVVRDGEIVIRPMMYVALTYDHRIIDGRESVTFLKRIKEGVENPARLLLEV